LGNGFLSLIRKNQRAVVNILDRLLSYSLENGCTRVLAMLRIHRSQHGIFAHDDLIGGEGNQRPS
jgi:hypothetical protein